MKRTPQVLHIVDDATATGVSRVVEFISTSDNLARHANHKIHQVERGQFGAVPMDADIIVSHTTISWRTLPALIALRASRPNIPMIHVEHNYTASFVTHNVKHRARFMGMLKVGYSLFTRVVAVSDEQAAWMVFRNLVADTQVTTIQSCVDLTAFECIPSRFQPIRTIGAIGRLDQQKGFDLLIPAFRALPDPALRLMIFGTGPKEANLRQRAAGDERIEFAGFCSDATQPMRNVDAVVMPSRWEAFGLVAIEALAAHRPLLCARADGLIDHAQLGVTYFDDLNVDCIRRGMEDFIAAPNTLPKGGQYAFSNRKTHAFEDGWLKLILEVLCTGTPKRKPEMVGKSLEYNLL